MAGRRKLGASLGLQALERHKSFIHCEGSRFQPSTQHFARTPKKTSHWSGCFRIAVAATDGEL
jgi:hypothetical protein